MVQRMMAKETGNTVSGGDIFDSRAFKNIISTKTVSGATHFLNADAEDQSNALMKLKTGFEYNHFKCFQAGRLNKEKNVAKEPEIRSNS